MNLEGRRESKNVVVRKQKRVPENIERVIMKGSPRERWDDMARKYNDEHGWDYPNIPSMDEIEYRRWEEADDNAHNAIKQRKKNRAPEPAKRDKTNVNIGRRRSLEGEDLGEYKMR